jgi:Protein of unknown function (DUF3263)
MSEQRALLSERARALLDFERDWLLHQGRKEAAIRDQFGMSPARYYQLLARVVEMPEAETYDPLTTKRLRRRRQDRERQRTARALDWPR